MIANQTKSARTETAKILLFDVETSPNIGYCWGKWDQNIIEFIRERQIICYAWKWLGEKKARCKSLSDFPGYKRNKESNRDLIESLHALISKADIIVGHNIDGFDDKRANTDFIKHGLPPPPPHKTVDTLKIARAKFQFNSNRLGDLGVLLGVGDKIKHGGFELWRRCLDGDMKAWREMKAYNCGDVELLEKIYLKERPWMTSHPAIKPRAGVECPQCGSGRIQSRGTRITRKGRTPIYQCQDCGAWASGILVKKEWRIK